jgi:hypothetical protein
MKITEIITETAAWQKKSGKNKNGGLNKKGVASYRREHPGSKLQTAVTTKPSKLKKGSKAAKRRKSFCARMGGMKGPMKKPNGKPTRKALALRKWHCESVEQLEQLLENAKQRLDPKCWTGYHKAGTKIKGGVRVNNCVKNESEEPSVNGFVKQFAPWVAEQLGIELPTIKLLDKPQETTFGQYVPDEKIIYLVTGGRHPVDVLRTLAHELTHYKQDSEDNLPPGAGNTGTEQENEANANAGIMMRDFAEQNPEYFGLKENFADGKKPGRKGLAKRRGVDCKQSATKLRSIAAHSSGEKQRMAHWCANMKSGKKK